MRFRYAGAVALLLACWMAASPSPHAATSAPEAKKIVRLLDGTGLRYTSHKGTVWTVDFTGKRLGRSTVVVTYDKNLVVMFAVIGKNAATEKTPPMMRTLLHANHSFDYVKIGFDDDGDLFVRIDAPLRITDARQLKDDIEQVMSVSDAVFGQVALFIRH